MFVHHSDDLREKKRSTRFGEITSDGYYYQILVFTGQRIRAGTDSKVYVILSGEEKETSVRRLEDSYRKIFQRGQTDAFLFAVPK